ncbi:5-(carboxyamino)imidazole ribonucleotide mutase [Salsipaludibacter albus]|uniref:5-(carboxyamino)imidazole ribonucleotide mutase n=1 Tax=Salsipaludibacter albus TaxID=2849650 RepID=UPI001EE3AD90|nr:5-(carboxyamino)imidazole ribonucleotide mutase [Salsipaludibacter albus]MBY5161175.1 5-(carboxyamino)imidazole ribonucleotide mutase [Salsipaludibacter albus]
MTATVGIVMGSKTDLPVMEKAAKQLEDFGIPYTLDVMSAHRNPAKVTAWASSAAESGYGVLIAGAGRAAHLPGVVAAHTALPVIGVPCLSDHLGGADALYSIVQMPPGVPVATVGIDNAKNAAILAAQILALSDDGVAEALADFRAAQADKGMEHRSWTPDGGAERGGFGFQP